MRMGWISALALLLALPLPSSAGPILRQPPAQAGPGQEYLFFLHGKIVEEQGIRPSSPKYGVYEYEAILRAFAGQGFTVISEARPKDTPVRPYAEKVAAQVRELLARGVPPGRITVVGFSKGGVIALLVSTLLANDRVHFAFLAACNPKVQESLDPRLRGRVLSLWDDPDEYASSCAPIFARSPKPLVHQEVVFHDGLGHGYFFRPQKGWVERVAAWTRKNP